jgi:nucleotide-binding universal stress UspA family protein
MDSRIPRGTVAQLDALTRPTHVDPEELAPQSHRVGPVLLALVPDEHATGAVEFARELAEQWDRSLVVAYVPPLPARRDLESISASAARVWERYQREASLEALAAFMDEHDLAGVETQVRAGRPAEAITELAERDHIAAIVCGCRRRSEDRWFAGTTVRELVRTARRPIIAVPHMPPKRS